MAVHVQRSNDALVIDRIRSRRRPAGRARSCKDAVTVVREVVRRSATVDDATSAVKAIDAAWSKTTETTCEASEFMLTILGLADSVADAVSVVERLRDDASFLEPLTKIQEFVQTEFPGAKMRIVPGDEVSSAYLNVRIPTEDYPSFWAAHVRLLDWTSEHFPKLFGLIHVMSLPASVDV